MAWLDLLQGQTVGLDTAPLVYFVEEHPGYLGTVRPFFQALSRGEIRVVTSTVTLLEVLVQPLRQGDAGLAERYRDILLNSEGITVCPFSADVAEEAARLRAAHSIRTPDAIQVATALCNGASYLLTNDAQLASLPSPRMLVLSELRTGIPPAKP